MSQAINKGDRVKVTVEGEWAGWDGITPSGAVALLRAEKMEILPDDTVTVEKLDPEPKFKPGDRVRVLEDRAECADVKKGQILTVTRVYATIIDAKDPRGRTWAFTISKGSVEPAPDQTFKLKWGDRIRNTKSGRVGAVAVGADSHLWVVDPSTYDEETGATAAAVEEYEEHFPGTYEIISREGGPF